MMCIIVLIMVRICDVYNCFDNGKDMHIMIYEVLMIRVSVE